MKNLLALMGIGVCGSKGCARTTILRLGQLQDALLRNARFIVGIETHTGKMSFDEAVAFFARIDEKGLS